MAPDCDSAPARPEARMQSRTFLALYALAVAGGSTAYSPFLTLLLPLHVSEEWGDKGVVVLSSTAFAGAIAASIANILFGWLSDRTGNRRGWMLAGVIASSLLLPAMMSAQSVAGLVTLIVLWQFALNMFLGPLSAWAGDCVPDEQKGTLGGLLSVAPGLGALSGAIITLPGLLDSESRLLVNVGLVCAMALPAILLARPRPMPHLMVAADREPGEVVEAVSSPLPVWRMWLARLLVQVAEASLFAFLLLWLRSIDSRVSENLSATIFTTVLFGAVPLAIAAGRWSDRVGRPILPLAVAATGGAIGLLTMAVASSTAIAVAGYMLFGLTSAVFLALHSSQTLRVLPRPQTRGRDLGVFNLTNTVPSLIMPGLALALIPPFGFKPMFGLLAVLLALAVVLLRPRRKS